LISRRLCTGSSLIVLSRLKQEKIKKKLKAKLEMAKFLQDTLEETALTGSENQPKEETVNYKFAEFMKKVGRLVVVSYFSS
jgi:hypothetical protein